MLCFHLGAVKQVFADQYELGDIIHIDCCPETYEVVSRTLSWMSCYSVPITTPPTYSYSPTSGCPKTYIGIIGATTGLRQQFGAVACGTGVLSGLPYEITEMIYGLSNAPNPCQSEFQTKIQECSGEEFIVNWDNATCTGKCAAVPAKNLDEPPCP